MWALTCKIGHCLQLLLPVLRDMEALVLHALSLDGHALLVGVVHDLLQVLGMYSVQDIEEVLPRWTFANGVLVREVDGHVGILLELGPELLDGELVISRHLDVLHLRLLQ